MLRVIAALVGIPFMLALSLALAMHMGHDSFGFFSGELLELGLLPVVLAASLWLLLIFLPLLFVAARIARLSMWSVAAVGFLSALLPVLASTWPVLVDSKLRMNFRTEQVASSFPLLMVGATCGLLFWFLAIFRNGELPVGLAKRT